MSERHDALTTNIHKVETHSKDINKDGINNESAGQSRLFGRKALAAGLSALVMFGSVASNESTPQAIAEDVPAQGDNVGYIPKPLYQTSGDPGWSLSIKGPQYMHSGDKVTYSYSFRPKTQKKYGKLVIKCSLSNYTKTIRYPKAKKRYTWKKIVDSLPAKERGEIGIGDACSVSSYKYPRSEVRRAMRDTIFYESMPGYKPQTTEQN